MSFRSVSLNGDGFSNIYTLPNRRCLIAYSTMRGLSLDNDKRKETMNSYFMPTANSRVKL